MEDFETMLNRERISVERYVRFRMQSRADADDVLQETWIAAYRNYDKLKSPEAFRAWVLSIARRKCADYFRRRSVQLEIPIDALKEDCLVYGVRGVTVGSVVEETLEKLGDQERQILYLYFWKELPQAEIAKRLHIPVGTVKSRLFYAKEHFRRAYLIPPTKKGDLSMKQLPDYLPEYSIRVTGGPAEILCEELMGWFTVPRIGEKLSWAMYDQPSRKRTYSYQIEVVGKASVHGIEGVEMHAVGRGVDPTGCSDPSDPGEQTSFIAQLTDTHSRFLAVSRNANGVHVLTTFLDGEDFTMNWGFGEDNVGAETHLVPKGEIVRSGDQIRCPAGRAVLDVVDRCALTFGDKTYDVLRVMDVEDYETGVVSEQYLNAEGRTVLWRRFNRDDWQQGRWGKPWHELLPENERLWVNGKLYVHWYDCITDHSL